MASKYDSRHVVDALATVITNKESYAYALGYIGGELVDAIEMLSPKKREKFLELLARHTEDWQKR